MQIFLKEYGVEVPTTLDELKEASKQFTKIKWQRCLVLALIH